MKLASKTPEHGAGDVYRRLAGRVGSAKVVTATARDSRVFFYNAMRFGTLYEDAGEDLYDRRYLERVLKQLPRRYGEFGFSLKEVKTQNVS